MSDQRNFIITIVLSIAILLGFQFLVEKPRIERQRAEVAARQEQSVPAPAAEPGAPAAAPSATASTMALRDRTAVIAEQAQAGQRIKIDTPALHGSINLKGGRIDDLTLAEYRETPNPGSPEIVLLSPAGSEHAYYVESGWLPRDPSVPAPGPDTMWSAAGTQALTPKSPVVLTWNNGKGLAFERTIAVDERFMFTVTQKITNTGAASVALMPYSLASRTGTPQTLGYAILHEGPLGVFNARLTEKKYAELQKEHAPVIEQSKGGWIGITDKYWLVSVIPDQNEDVTARFLHTDTNGVERYQVDFAGAARDIAPGTAIESTSRVFAGAKQVRLLDDYANRLGIAKFDLAIDFGWFYFLTKPFFYALDLIAGVIGNFGIAILIFTVIVKGVFFPLANKSYHSLAKMKKIQPEVNSLRERFADDKVRMNQEMMALYKREKVSPVSGCLPIVIQIPVFFALYKVLFVTIEMRQAPFFGWIHDLSAPDPTTMFNLFGAIPWDPPTILHIGIWPLIMGVTMWAQQKLNPPPADPMQQKIFAFLPIMFTFMLANFPAGLVIYWAWNNSLSIAQQWVIMRQAGVKVS